MIRHYLTIALRHIRRQKTYALINVFGLAVGMAACWLIFLYVHEELTYDAFHDRGDRIYRVTEVEYNPDGSVDDASAYLPYPMKAALESDIPEVEEALRTEPQTVLLRLADRTFEEQILCADPEFFSVFSFPMVAGSPETALADRNSIVLTETAAVRLFPDGSPLGRTLEVRLRDRFETLTVTAIARDVPGNTNIPFEIVVPFDKLAEASGWLGTRDAAWNSYSFSTWVLLREGATEEAFEAKMPAFLEKYRPGIRERLVEAGRWDSETLPRGFQLQPLAEVHLDPSVWGGIVPPSDTSYAWILSGIAAALLLIACINFMTLAIGRSAGRAREVGIRKAAGARRRELMAQFWGEAILMVLLAVGLGLVLVSISLPTFNQLAEKSLTVESAPWALSAGILLGLVLVAGLVAGSYPALVLSSLRPVETLYRTPRLGGSNVLTRSLVIVQFALAVGLIAATAVMMQQIHYLLNRNLGFDEENLVVVDNQSLPGRPIVDRMRHDLTSRAGIAGVTGVSAAFTHGWDRRGWDYEGSYYRAYVYNVQSDYLDVMGIPLVDGRFFDASRPADTTGSVVVNEAFVRMMEWTDPVGQTVPGIEGEPSVIGVIEDIHNRSLHVAIEPILLEMNPEGSITSTLVRISPDDVAGSLAAIDASWRRSAPELPLKFTFLDDDLQRQYTDEERWSRIVAYSGGLAVVLACMGLFGLAALTVARRTKEIGIRKVLGATGPRIAALLSVEFARPVLLACAISLPAAWWVLQRWLDGYAYSVSVSALVLGGSALLVLLLALSTVAVQSWRAARTDPVRSLRYE